MMSLSQVESLIEVSCGDIRRAWDEMLDTTIKSPSLQPSFGSGGARTSTQTRQDNSNLDDDVDRLDSIISLRIDIQRCMQSWCRVIIEDLRPDGPYPSGADVKTMCAFAEANARMMSGHEDGELMATELAKWAEKVDRVLTPGRPASVALGPCPIVDCSGVVRANPAELDDVTGEVVAACTRCGTVDTISHWCDLMEIEMPSDVTIEQIINLAYAGFGMRITRRAVEGLVRRGTLVPVGEDPQRFALQDVIEYLTRRSDGC